MNSTAPKVGDKIFTSTNQENAIGEVVAVEEKGLVGVAMMQLDAVYRHEGVYRVENSDNNAIIFQPDWFTGLDETTNLRKD